MNDGFLLSVIIPVFNDAEYLPRCINSLKDLANTEIIIVDDGSQDGSVEVAEEYAEKYEQIKLFRHDKNHGVVKSRCDGINRAEGSFVAFVDSDDWVDSSFLEKAMFELMNNSELDIVAGRMLIDNHAGKYKTIGDIEKRCVIDGTVATNELFKWNYYRWELCGKVFRGSLFDGWTPDEEIKVCEDLDSTWELFKRSRNTLLLPMDYYHYFFNENSASYSVNILNSNSYRVFEKVLREGQDFLTDKVVGVVKEHYRLCLVNLVREGIFAGKEDEIIIEFQDKWKSYLLSVDEGNIGFATSDDTSDSEDADFLMDVLKARQIVNTFKAGTIKLYDAIHSGKVDVYLYGTGAVASFVGRILQESRKQGFDFVVSDGEMKRSKFLDKEVFYLSDIPKDSSIILALNRGTQNVVSDLLKERGYKNIYQIETYGIV